MRVEPTGEAVAYLEQALGALQHLPESRDTIEQAIDLRLDLQFAFVPLGEVGPTLDHLRAEEAVQWGASMGRVGQSPRLAYLSETYLLAGRMDRVLELARRALMLSREHKERGHEAYTLRLLSEIAAQCDPPELEPAEAYHGQAVTLADELGMRPLLAYCHLGFGTLYAKIGRWEQARSELAAAIEPFRSRQMNFWLTRAEAALAQAEGR